MGTVLVHGSTHKDSFSYWSSILAYYQKYCFSVALQVCISTWVYYIRILRNEIYEIMRLTLVTRSGTPTMQYRRVERSRSPSRFTPFTRELQSLEYIRLPLLVNSVIDPVWGIFVSLVVCVEIYHLPNICNPLLSLFCKWEILLLMPASALYDTAFTFSTRSTKSTARCIQNQPRRLWIHLYTLSRTFARPYVLVCVWGVEVCTHSVIYQYPFTRLCVFFFLTQ